MERLTKRRNGVCTYIGPRCMYPDTGETAAEMDFINARTVLERLSAYEDTGLEPEEIEHIKNALIGKSIAEINEFDGIPIKRLQELAKAEKVGRLVVLPEGINKIALVARLHWLESAAYIDKRETYTTGYRNGHRNGVIETLRSVLGSTDGTRQQAEEALREENERG